MCDYSLHAHETRLAEVGDELTLVAFPGGSLGFTNKPREHGRLRLIDWVKHPIASFFAWIDPYPIANTCATCCPPGAVLQLSGISKHLQKNLGVSATEEVTFDQLESTAYMHRDYVRFKNGRTVLLQRLPVGAKATVISVDVKPEVAKVRMREAEAANVR